MSIQQLVPNDVWGYFHQLNQVPRPSKHEDKIQAFMVEFGEALGLDTFKDQVGNVIIRKPATAGMENRQGVVLQSHLDMVPQANKDTQHNFETDPIETVIDGEWVRANGTTLGADNGMGVAAIMAVLASKDLVHGPIEALFTCDEETGMTGAIELKSDVLKGDILLNLDSEDESELYVGCAGGIDATFDLPLVREARPADHKTYQVVLKGLQGGHSGLNIIDQRGNANKLLARWLVQASQDIDVRLYCFFGGNLRNAIPREADIVISTANEVATKAHLDNYLRDLQNEYEGVEESIVLSMEEMEGNGDCLTAECQQKVIHAINACHNGVYRMSVDMDNLVETSSNLAIVETTVDTLTVKCLLRSSVDSAREQLASELSSTFMLSGATRVEFSGAYPGWKPNPNSHILTVMKATGEKVFGHVPEVKAIHAGLECGILGGHYPNWDMISFGPTIRGAHSPDEKVHIKSVETFYEWLKLTLQAVPEKA